MAVGPRIVFARVSSVDNTRFRTWVEHTARVVGTAPDFTPGPEDGAVVWSLVSANNRELARSSRIFGRFDEAYASAEQTVGMDVALEPRLVSDRRLGGYGWFLDKDDTPEVVCARWYDSDRDRRQAIAVARMALRTPTLQVGARLVATD